ncbi:MAG TPA: four helix bundle protein [Candidatus Paceibacterota bacterium]
MIEHVLAVYKLWFEYRDNFPRKSRYTLGDRIDARFIQILELLFAASYQSREEKLPTIARALTGIDALKFLLRVAWEMRVLDTKKYADLSEQLHEIGRMVGGWKKGLQTKTPAPRAGERRA